MQYKKCQVSVDGTVIGESGRVLKHSISGNGYLTVCVSGRNACVHRVLAECFIPNPDNKPCVNHIDGNKLNNSLDNLEWATYSENNQHAYNIGLKTAAPSHGESHGMCKLTNEDVYVIRYLYSKGESQKDIAILFGASRRYINDLVNHRLRTD
jgi:hypothetical protein